MALTAEGIKFLALAATGNGTPFNGTNARLGVGNSNAVFAVNQTDLQGTSKFRKVMDTGYPVVAAPKLSFKSTFAPNEANFPWNEWGIFNAATGGVMLNRVVESNGTKQSNQTWVLEVDITFAIGQ
jgi:hypothetical protein